VWFLVTQLIACGSTVMPYARLHNRAYHCAESSFKDCILQLAAARQHDALMLASAGPRFHQKSGVWSDTQAALQDRGNDSGLVTELDPDATTRCLTISCCPCVAGLLFPDAGWSPLGLSLQGPFEILSDHCPISTSGAYLLCNRTLFAFLSACLSEIFRGMLCKAVRHQRYLICNVVTADRRLR